MLAARCGPLEGAAFPPRSLGAPSSRLIARQENSAAARRELRPGSAGRNRRRGRCVQARQARDDELMTAGGRGPRQGDEPRCAGRTDLARPSGPWACCWPPPLLIALATLTACGSLAANGQGSGGGGTSAATGTAARHGGLCASRGGLTSLVVRRVGILPLLRQEESRVRAHSTVAAERCPEGRRRDLRAAPGPARCPELPDRHRHHLQAVLHRRIPALRHGHRTRDRLPAGDRGGQAAYRGRPSRLLGRAGQGRPAAAAPAAREPGPSRPGRRLPPGLHGPDPARQLPGPEGPQLTRPAEPAVLARGGPPRCFPDGRRASERRAAALFS